MSTKEQRLRNFIKQYKNVIVAYSGGIDSSLVAKIASEILKEKALIIISDSPSLPRYELESAQEIAKNHDFNLKVITTQEMENENYTSNPYNRCYFCKKELYGFLKDISSKGVPVFDGTNYDDLKDIRHGRQAAKELGIISPLVECQFSKKDIRQLAKDMGLENWNKPQEACLSSRFPQGTTITSKKLQLVENAEFYLKNLGLSQLRVRYHDNIARIELGKKEEMDLLIKNNMKIHSYFLSLGFQFVTIDILGYRRKETQQKSAL